MDDFDQRYPLCWPDGWRRTPPAKRAYGRFTKRREGWGSDYVTITSACDRILTELVRMGVAPHLVIISTNIRLGRHGHPRSGERRPDDPGAAVYWSDMGRKWCLAVDRYTDVSQNLAAIAATLDAMRAIERHGGAEILDRAFTGFAALPSPEQWWQVLGFTHSRPTLEEVEQRFRELAMRHHPDRGGDDATMARFVVARDQAREALR